MNVFVDTSAFFAYLVPREIHHVKTRLWLHENPVDLVTTDYVIDEVLTLMRARGEATKAVEFGRRVFDLNGMAVHFLQRSEIQNAWIMFRDNPGRWWSFTDCTSKVVMDALHIRQVLTYDRHFAEFGAILPLQ